MGRDLDAGLQTLLSTRPGGPCRPVFTLDVQLQDGTELHLATRAVTVGATIYNPLLDTVGPLILGLFGDDDSQEFKVSNVDPTFGQALTGQVNMLDGARATGGVVYVNTETSQQWYDERIPGELLAGEVTERTVAFDLVDEVYATDVAGELATEVFPFRQPPAPAVRPDPNDTNFPVGPVVRPGGEDGAPTPGRPGRYPMPLTIF